MNKDNSEKKQLVTDSSEKETSEQGTFLTGNVRNMIILKNKRRNNKNDVETFENKTMEKGNAEQEKPDNYNVEEDKSAKGQFRTGNI